MGLPNKFTFTNMKKNSKTYKQELAATFSGVMNVYLIVGLGDKGGYCQTSLSRAAAQVEIDKGFWLIHIPEEGLNKSPEERDMYIASNQIVCSFCEDSIFSMHRHHYVTCSCGNCSVDGGQSYLKRSGSGWKDVSITIEQEALDKLVADIAGSMDSGRNPVGVALAALRSIRDHDISQEGLKWVLRNTD